MSSQTEDRGSLSDTGRASQDHVGDVAFPSELPDVVHRFWVPMHFFQSDGTVLFEPDFVAHLIQLVIQLLEPN